MQELVKVAVDAMGGDSERHRSDRDGRASGPGEPYE